jgi:hypothetical protein
MKTLLSIALLLLTGSGIALAQENYSALEQFQRSTDYKLLVNYANDHSNTVKYTRCIRTTKGKAYTKEKQVIRTVKTKRLCFGGGERQETKIFGYYGTQKRVLLYETITRARGTITADAYLYEYDEKASIRSVHGLNAQYPQGFTAQARKESLYIIHPENQESQTIRIPFVVF